MKKALDKRVKKELKLQRDLRKNPTKKRWVS